MIRRATLPFLVLIALAVIIAACGGQAPRRNVTITIRSTPTVEPPTIVTALKVQWRCIAEDWNFIGVAGYGDKGEAPNCFEAGRYSVNISHIEYGVWVKYQSENRFFILRDDQWEFAEVGDKFIVKSAPLTSDWLIPLEKEEGGGK